LVTTSSRSRASKPALRDAGSPTSVGPSLEAAVQDRDLLGAEVAKHEPAARGGAYRGIVVDDKAILAADAEAFHRRGEIGGAREHVRSGVRAIAELVDVEKPGAADVRREIFVAAAASRRGHEPGRVDCDEIGLAEVLRQPVGRDERVHGVRIGAPRDCC
jgi:hypothetical protein